MTKSGRPAVIYFPSPPEQGDNHVYIFEFAGMQGDIAFVNLRESLVRLISGSEFSEEQANGLIEMIRVRTRYPSPKEKP